MGLVQDRYRVCIAIIKMFIFLVELYKETFMDILYGIGVGFVQDLYRVCTMIMQTFIFLVEL